MDRPSSNDDPRGTALAADTMKPYARWTHALAIPFLALLSASAWYPLRIGAVHALVLDGAASADVASVLAAAGLSALLGTLAAGILAFATPWTPLLVGLCVAGTGGLLLGVAPPSLASVAMAIAAFGHGMVMPAALGVAARALDGARGPLRDGVFVAAYVAVNVGALLASTLSGTELLREHARGVMLAAAGLHLGAFVLTGVLAGVAYAGREPDEVRPAPRAVHLGAVAVLLVLVAFPWATSQSSWELLEQWVHEEMELAFTINPSVVIAFGGLLALAFPIAYALGVRRFPTLVLVGLGCVITGATTFGLVVRDPDAGVTTVFLLIGLGAVGEVLVLPLVYSRLAADLPFRLGTLAIALFMALIQLPAWLLRLFDAADLAIARPLAVVGAGAGLLVGLALLAGGAPARRLFEPPKVSSDPKQF